MVFRFQLPENRIAVDFPERPKTLFENVMRRRAGAVVVRTERHRFAV
jgi:hypothetical protein